MVHFLVKTKFVSIAKSAGLIAISITILCLGIHIGNHWNLNYLQPRTKMQCQGKLVHNCDIL